MKHLHKHSLRVSRLERSISFYQQKLGMTLVSRYTQDGREACLLGYAEDREGVPPTLLELTEFPDFMPAAGDLPAGYWKIALSVPDVNLARRCLLDKGVEVTAARQVPEVAYLCHFADPDGHCIELIQHRFEANHQPVIEDPGLPLGCAAVFSLITYRVRDPQQSVAFYESLGMRLMSRQDVSFAGFTLYFLGYSDEALPDPDICALANREWLWQRPYTLIELQHNWGSEQTEGPVYDCGAERGFEGVEIVTDEADMPPGQLQDPDGYHISIRRVS